MNNFTFVKKILLFFLVSMTMTSLQAQNGGLEVISVTSCPGNTVDVHIKGMNWDLVTTMQFSMTWDETVLDFTGTSTALPAFDQMLFNPASTPSGVISASWYDQATQGITLDDEIIFIVSFNVVGELGESTVIDFSGTPILVEFTKNVNGDIEVFDPVLTAGSISLELPDVGSAVVENETGNSSNGYVDVVYTGGTAPYTYLWSNEMTTASITGLPAGDYTVEVTDASGCSNELGPFAVGQIISTNEIQNLSVFALTPNPASDLVTLNVEFDQLEDTTIKIYSLIGQEMYSNRMNAQAFDLQIPLKDFGQGAYLLELTTKNGKAVEKLIVTE